MAKDRGEMVQVPAAEWEEMKATLAQLLHKERVRQEQEPGVHAKSVIEQRHEEFERNSMRSAQERTQEIADKTYGTDGPRWRCRLDSTTEDGRPGPDVSNFFALELSANSDLEAQARYLQAMGIRKHDYKVLTMPVQTANAA